jgi:UDP-GlcNAc3NAcA epimerase
MITVLTIVGARPQFIKAAALSREIKNYPQIKEIIVHTGQHFDINMSDVFFEEMKIPKPDYFLGIHGLNHGAMTGQMLEKIEEVILKEKPNWVLVYGDTNSTLAGALAAKKLHFKVIHVEAGLRSFNMNMPEEINRILTDRISDILFCPTKTAIKNLKNEGYNKIHAAIKLSGDIMEDNALYYAQFANKPDIEIQGEFVLATVHRAENTSDENILRSIFNSLSYIANQTTVILPLHPRTKQFIKKLNINTGNIILIDPLGYLNMVWLIKNCNLVITDSGGLQKEAYFFNKFCITLRNETEWVELVNSGYNQLVGCNSEKIKSAFLENYSKTFIKKEKFYGGGKAARKIIEVLLKQSN